VNIITSVIDTDMDNAYRQVGLQKLTFNCPAIIWRYQQNMFGVDKGDQIRAAGGGFALKAHYKKWYKKVSLHYLML